MDCDLKLLKKVHAKKGFTLIEMVIVIAVLTIILSFITAIFVQIMRIETEIADVAQVEIIAAESVVELIDDLRIAKAIDTTNAVELKIATEDYTVTYSIDSTQGILVREYENDDPPGAKPVLASGFYMGHTMQLSWTEQGSATTGDYTLRLIASLYDSNNNEVYAEEYVVRPTFINANA